MTANLSSGGFSSSSSSKTKRELDGLTDDVKALSAEETVRIMQKLFGFSMKWGWRLFVTLASCWTVQSTMQSQGYRVSFWNVLLAAACTILTMRAWMPQAQPTD